MDKPKVLLWTAVAIAAISFWSGLILAPDPTTEKLNLLEAVIVDGKAELSKIERDITYVKSTLKDLQTELADAERELQVTTSSL